MVKTSLEKKYYEKINLKLHSVNNNDQFYEEISNAIRSGKNVIYQKRMREAQVFDAKWIEVIEMYLNSVDNIVRNPRRYMMAVEDVVNIEKAKKINARSIQHLSSHTQFVQDIDDEGRVVPSKVLSTFYEDELAIYENRFVMTLINKLAAFVEKRYDIVKDHMVCAQIDRLNVNSKFKWRNFDIECNVDIKVTEDVDDEVNRKNKELLERLITIRKYSIGFMNSEFFKTVKSKAAPILPPILRTNLILKSVNYNNCLKLWQFLDSYRHVGFDVDILEKNLEFDEEYINSVYDLVIMNYSAIVANQEDRAETYHLQQYKARKIKAPTVVPTLVNENIAAGKEKVEEASANEYFYQRTRKTMEKQYEEIISTGKGYNATVVQLYRQMQGISNSIYKELFTKIEPKLDEFETKKEKDKAKFEYLRRKKTVLNSVVFAKQADVRNAKAELTRIEKQLERMKKAELEFQKKLKEDRTATLAAAREETKKKAAEEKARLRAEKAKEKALLNKDKALARKLEKERLAALGLNVPPVKRVRKPKVEEKPVEEVKEELVNTNEENKD